MLLRDYQQKQIDQIWKEPQDSPLIQAPTGTGKGNQIAYLLDYLAVIRNQKIVCIVPTHYLISNIYDRFIEYYPDRSYLITDCWRNAFSKNILVVTYQSFCLHLDCFNPDWIIIDEAHISACESIRIILDRYKVPAIGFTATPARLSGEPLDMFDRLIPAVLSTQEFINQGYLADFDLYTTKNPDIEGLLGGTVRGDSLGKQSKLLSSEISIESQAILWRKYAFGLKTIFFVSSKVQGQALKDYLKSRYSYDFEYIDSTTPYKIRDQVLSDFRSGKLQGLINIELLIMGIDVPDCQCVFSARATNSLTYWLQFVGRALRPKRDNSKAIIIDPVGNALRHGSPAFDYEWSLLGTKDCNQKNNRFCCIDCGIPLVPKNKVDNRGIQIFCFNCGAENWFVSMNSGKPYYSNPQKRKKLIIELEKFETDQLNWSTHKLISDPKIDIARKREFILSSRLTVDQKRSALLFLGDKPEIVDMWLN